MDLPITYIIIGITCLVSFFAFNNPELKYKMLFLPTKVKNHGESYRFLSHGFIHSDFRHLLFNMYALYIFGPTAEVTFSCILGPVFGDAGYLVFYLVAIMASSYVSYSRHQDNHAYGALGASGAVAAMMWPFIMYDPWAWFIFPPLPAFILGIGYIAYSHYADQRGNSNIGHNAHLWGAIFGLVAYAGLSLAFQPDIIMAFFERLGEFRMPNDPYPYYSPCG